MEYNRQASIKVGKQGYLKYQPRDYGINLVWSDVESFEWEIRKADGKDGEVKSGEKIRLYNHVIKDYLVYGEREYGINLRWLKDVKKSNASDWIVTITGQTVSFKNITAEQYMVYGERTHGINLVWEKKKPNPGNISVKTLKPATYLPDKPDYWPGEKEFCKDRPENWMVEWNGNVGLNFNAYDSLLRAPYIQNIKTNSAVVLWRVAVPREANLKNAIAKLEAEIWLAEEKNSFAQTANYKIGNGIEIKQVFDTYLYKNGATYAKDVTNGNSDIDLNSIYKRPFIELRCEFKNLKSHTIYHYRIKSSTLNPERSTSKPVLKKMLLANDVFFKTAPTVDDCLQDKNPVRFVAMGDLGPGNDDDPITGRDAPSYFYDVNDLFQAVSRKYGAQLWLALGDLDNDTDGNPNAMDPFFFNVYNAYSSMHTPKKTSPLVGKAEDTNVVAFQKPPYLGLLGGLPVFPTFGNHDISLDNGGSLSEWKKSYLGNFVLPTGGTTNPEAYLNTQGKGFFYTYRYGNVIFISLGLPDYNSNIKENWTWESEWGTQQQAALNLYLNELKPEIEKSNIWVVVYFHDHNWGKSGSGHDTFSKMLANHGVDLVLAGHKHGFSQKTVTWGANDYRMLVVGTGGFGDAFPWPFSCDPVYRPGFVFLETYGNQLCYWKLDTHRCDESGQPLGRKHLQPMFKEYCTITKKGFGSHQYSESILNIDVPGY